MRYILLFLVLTPGLAAAPTDPGLPTLVAARQFAARTLQQMESSHHARVALPPTPSVDLGTLRTAMNDDDLDVYSASAAAFTLGATSTADLTAAVDALLRQMERVMFAIPDFQHDLIMALGARAVPALTRHLNNSMVLDLLGEMGPEAAGAVPALKNVLGTRNVEVASALASVGTEEAISAALPVLLRAAEDPFSPWAKNAATALGTIGRNLPRAALPTLRGLLQSPNPDTRLAAAISLGRAGDSDGAARALGTLVRGAQLHDPHDALVELQRLGANATPAVNDLVAFTRDEDTRLEFRAAAATLAKVAPRNQTVIDTLRSAANDPRLAPLLSPDVIDRLRP